MKHTPEEIKNRLSNIGEAIGNIALDYITELEKENAELNCECRRCVYTDCPCVLSDYEKDRNGICDHFKDVFDENAELKSGCGMCYRKDKEQLTKAKELIRFWVNDFYDGFNSSIRYEERRKALKESEQFLKDSEVEK